MMRAALTPIQTAFGALVALAAALPAAAPPQEPGVDQVVSRLGRYVTEYGARVSLLVGVERYEQRVVDGNVRRTLVSEIAFVPVRGDWLAYRDVFEVDGEKVGDRPDRLQRLLVDSPPGYSEQARQIADESARFNLGGVQRNFNTPTMCLFAMRPENAGRFKFKKTAEERVGDVIAWKIHFEEKDRPTIVRSPEGRDLPMTGDLWVQPSDGAVLRTAMVVEGRVARRSGDRPERVTVEASVEVVYEPDARLGMRLPSTMHETYRERSRGGGAGAGGTTVECLARYSDFKRFQTSARVVIPK